MKNILITGVTGFVGTSLVSYWQNKPGIKLFGHSRNAEQAKKQYAHYSIDLITSYDAAQLNLHNIDTIVHLAGIAHDLSNQYVESDYYRVNFQATTALYDEFLKSNASKFIYFSSIKAAVDHAVASIDESVIPNPVTPYGKSKLKAEQYIQQSNHPPSKSFYLLRPSMIHGPGNKGNLNLLYKFVRTGIPFPLGAFKNKRSFLNADNMTFLVNEIVTGNLPSGIYNLADSGTLSTNEVVAIIARAMHKSPRIWNMPPSLMRAIFKITGRSSMLGKLSDNMEVSNTKIMTAIDKSLPVSIEQGLVKTIQSFHA